MTFDQIKKWSIFWPIFWPFFCENCSKSGFEEAKNHHFLGDFLINFDAFTCSNWYGESRWYDPFWPLKKGQKRVKFWSFWGDFWGQFWKYFEKFCVQKVVEKWVKFYWDIKSENSIERGCFIGNCMPNMGSGSGDPQKRSFLPLFDKTGFWWSKVVIFGKS